MVLIESEQEWSKEQILNTFGGSLKALRLRLDETLTTASCASFVTDDSIEVNLDRLPDDTYETSDGGFDEAKDRSRQP